ncbi:MAG: DUF177 domain-containing protein [Pseudomonadota bacterium]
MGAPQASGEIGFSRPLRVDGLPKDAPHRFSETATAEERAAVARLFDVLEVAKLTIDGSLAPEADGAWLLTATIRATVTQRCVVSLAPVTSRLSETVRRLYVPDFAAEAEDTLFADEESEPLERQIDIGAVAVEGAALALPSYPRAPGAALDPQYGGAGGDEREKPFAALADLKAKLSEN